MLYFGYKKPWSGPLTLKERLRIPKECEPYVNDYKINLFQIAFLTEEQVKLFKSDFRIVADYLVQMRKNNDYVPDPTYFKHVHETIQLLTVMAQDSRFEEVYQEKLKQHKEGVFKMNMCDVFDKYENSGRAEGKAEGIIEGENKLALLVGKLCSLKRFDDVKKVAEDQNYRSALMKEFSIG